VRAIPKAQLMRFIARALLLLACVLCVCGRLHAQLPFYTDDTGVTESGKWHFEFFNEYDALQLQLPNLRQNTANFKLNYGLPHNFEFDVDVPYLSIYRTAGNEASSGVGDTNLGVKTSFHKESAGSHIPALAASLYIEFPTGDSSQQLGSGLHDYWLNFIAQKSLSEKTRLTANVGYLFAGNTSTGAIGTHNTRGHVVTGGLSLLHDFSPSLTLGGEIYGGYTNNGDLGKTQFQAMAGGQYAIRNGLSFCFGLLGGKYVASPQIGGQIGFAMDFPDFFHPSANHSAVQ
jgi:outer membrane putative beta-barrel porin/alpha-amylase